MKKSLLSAAALVACLAIGPRAEAQWDVFDSSNFANTLQTMKTAANQLTVLNNQLNQLRQTYQELASMQTMFTSPSNVTGMFPV